MVRYVTKPQVRWIRNRTGMWAQEIVVGLSNEPGAALVFEEGVESQFPGAIVRDFESVGLSEGHYRIWAAIDGLTSTLEKLKFAIETGEVIANPSQSVKKMLDQAKAEAPIPMMTKARLHFSIKSLDFCFGDRAPQQLAKSVLRYGGSLDLKRYTLRNSGDLPGCSEFVIHAEARYANFRLAEASQFQAESMMPNAVRARQLWDSEDDGDQIFMAA